MPRIGTYNYDAARVGCPYCGAENDIRLDTPELDRLALHPTAGLISRPRDCQECGKSFGVRGELTVAYLAEQIQ